MKKEKNRKVISAVMALLMLSSCSSTGTGLVSSVIAEGEKQNQGGFVSSTPAVETSSQTATSTPETEENSSKKPEQTGSSKIPNSNSSSNSNTSNTPSQNPASSEVSSSSKPIIPSDNPSPVTVNREDASTPTLISYTDKMLGEAIKFESQTVDVRSNTPWLRHIAIIRSYDELKELWQQEAETLPKSAPPEYAEKYNYVKLYTEEFFEEKAIILMFICRGISSPKYLIDSVTQKDGRMYIHIKNEKRPGSASNAISLGVSTNYRTFINISKKELSEVKDIVAYLENY